VSELVSSIVGEMERVDGLVSNAGTNLRSPSTCVDATAFDYLFAVNVRGAFLLAAGILPVMVLQVGGAIVNVSSIRVWWERQCGLPMLGLRRSEQ
jgi:NADP-dependent 3-hydroxy acid dehydrogenase YdfG